MYMFKVAALPIFSEQNIAERRNSDYNLRTRAYKVVFPELSSYCKYIYDILLYIIYTPYLYALFGEDIKPLEKCKITTTNSFHV